jgi:hypothetical protein
MLAMAALAAGACGPIDDGGYSADVDRELDRGRDLAVELVTSAASAPTAEEAIAVGYLERLRLGMGSPFRLIEYSLQDPRLAKEDRERLAWALLARTLDGASYRVDPRALGQRGQVEQAARHLELVEGAVRGSADPDGGMLAVRLAYAMAAAERSVSESLRDRMSKAAALVRDRVQSRADAERLLRAAGDRTDPMSLLTVWRVERRFHVERPSPLAPPSSVERDAIALAPRLLESIRSLDSRPRAGPVIPADEPRHRPLLSEPAARALAELSALYDAPPQTPVAVAVRTFGRSSPDTLGPAVRFFEGAVNEERIAAEYALLWHVSDAGMTPRLAVLTAAVGLRAYAQERPWFPGFEGPTRLDLEDRFGLAAVEFPDHVPASWRPYYRRMLESGLSDLQRVLPSLDVRGLRVRFDARRESPGTLAVHDPRTRTVFIPTVTGAGTIAHEIAHDLDWQTALRRYRVRGDYATDRAVRMADQRLARVLQGLTTSALSQPVSSDNASHATRPAEIFARSVDWFATVALAREGRMNGYLSSVQDDVLTGYGTVTPPDVTGTAGQALIALLDEVAPVYPETRRWFLGSYGRLRAPTAYDLARRIVEPPLRVAASAQGSGGSDTPELARLADAMEQLDRLDVVRGAVLTLVDDACQAVAYDYGATDARRRLVRMATAARARGVAREASTAVAGPDGTAWLMARLEGRRLDPEPDSLVMETLDPLATRVRGLSDRPPAGEPLAALPDAAAPATDCGPLPFLLD